MTTMGIIFANIYDSSLGELTNKRTMASLPYGGRYRQIDFSLSNMTNSAIRHIGIITKYNYQSLMNHIGSGQEWDLELGEGGLEFLTPFAMGHNGSYRGKLEALDSAMNFLKISTEEYVVLADSGVLCAINLEKIVEAHAASGADVTVVVKDGICNGQKQLDLAVKVDADDRVTDVAVDYCAGEQYLASMGLFVIRRELLMREVTEAVVLATGLFVTMADPGGEPMTFSKRIPARSTNINRICRVNEVSRQFCHMELTVEEAYEELTKNVPKQGAFVETPAGYGIVTQVNLLRQMVKVKLDGEGDDTVKTYRAVEVAAVPGGRPKDGETPPSVLKYVPEPEAEEEEETDIWKLPELFADDGSDKDKESAPAQKKRSRNRRSRRGGKKPQSDAKPVPQPAQAQASEEKKTTAKPKPRNRRGGGKKPAEQSVSAEQPKPQQQAKSPDGEKKRSNRRYYHRGKPKNKGGQAQNQ